MISYRLEDKTCLRFKLVLVINSDVTGNDLNEIYILVLKRSENSPLQMKVGITPKSRVTYFAYKTN